MIDSLVETCESITNMLTVSESAMLAMPIFKALLWMLWPYLRNSRNKGRASVPEDTMSEAIIATKITKVRPKDAER